MPAGDPKEFVLVGDEVGEGEEPVGEGAGADERVEYVYAHDLDGGFRVCWGWWWLPTVLRGLGRR